MAQPRTLLIMPAWNEDAVIGATIDEVRRVLPDFDLLVVDDGSTDATAQIAKERAEHDDGVRLLSLPFNLGVGGAMRAGFMFARQYAYTQAIQIDADGQHDPRDVPAILEGLARANISIGARFGGRGDYRSTGPRRWAMYLLAAMISGLAHTKLTDVTSGFRAADEVAIRQYCEHFPVEYLGDTVDSLVVAIRSGLTVTQVPVEIKPRAGGMASHGPLKSAVYLVRSLFAMAIAMTRRTVERKP